MSTFYYLDFTEYQVRTTKEQRRGVRLEMTQARRDECMAYKLKLQRGQCFWCACDIDMSGHLDHILPIYRGGINVSSNLVASCRRCNLTKGTDQIEITNPYTIKDYLKLIEAYDKWKTKCATNRRARAYPPRRVALYGVYRASAFRSMSLERVDNYHLF